MTSDRSRVAILERSMAFLCLCLVYGCSSPSPPIEPLEVRATYLLHLVRDEERADEFIALARSWSYFRGDDLEKALQYFESWLDRPVGEVTIVAYYARVDGDEDLVPISVKANARSLAEGFSIKTEARIRRNPDGTERPYIRLEDGEGRKKSMPNLLPDRPIPALRHSFVIDVSFPEFPWRLVQAEGPSLIYIESDNTFHMPPVAGVVRLMTWADGHHKIDVGLGHWIHVYGVKWVRQPEALTPSSGPAQES